MLAFVIIAAILFGLDGFGVPSKGVSWTPLAWMCLTIALALNMGLGNILS